MERLYMEKAGSPVTARFTLPTIKCIEKLFRSLKGIFIGTVERDY
jgi:hypothetical protein